jgi:tRNA-splicing ligase RtcB
MSRTKAKKTLSVEDETKSLKERGILHAVRHQSDLDEAPGSYKDIQSVMNNQKDLVDIVIELQPLAVIKG